MKPTVGAEHLRRHGSDGLVAVQHVDERPQRGLVDPRVGIHQQDVRRGAAADPLVAPMGEAPIAAQDDCRNGKVGDDVDRGLGRRVVDDDDACPWQHRQRLDAAAQLVAAVVRDDDSVDPGHAPTLAPARRRVAWPVGGTCGRDAVRSPRSYQPYDPYP